MPALTDSSNALSEFAENLKQDVLQRAAVEEQESFIPEAFLAHVTELLAEEAEIEDAQLCYLRLRGVEVGAWALDPEEGRLDLFTAIHTGEVPPVTVTRDKVETAFRRMKTFFTKAQEGLYRELEEASPAFDMALQIHELRDVISRIRLFVITDGRTTLDNIPSEDSDSTHVSFHVWDVSRIERLASSGSAPEPIVVDLEEEYGTPLSSLPIGNGNGEYSAYLLLIPGEILASVYDRYGARLLESNVRTYLQARGKVNKGIRDTIRNEPGRFFAYNNGLTMTATAAVFDGHDGNARITRLEGLQIVNGGQTTASIFTAAQLDKLPVKEIDVAAKLIVAPAAVAEELVPSISRFSNTQNRVSQSDFSTNNPFHVELEKLSRSTWAPAVDGGQRQTRWFYERARGQYQDEKSRHRTPAQKREFTRINPTFQKFAKTDVAKFEHAWGQLPHLVSRGAQKNYILFFDELGKRNGFLPDERYFRQLVAKAILFRQTEKIVSSQKFGGYRANIVAYTIALLSNLSAQRIDLEKIWKEQSLPPALSGAIEDLCQRIQPILVAPPGGRNVTEWTKLEKCWKTVLEQVKFEIPGALEGELIPLGRVPTTGRRPGLDVVTTEDERNVEAVRKRGAQWWFTLSGWAKQTNNLQGWQRGIAFNIGKRIQSGAGPTARMAAQGVKIIEEADRLGFRLDEE